METNVVDYFEYGQTLGNSLGDAVVQTMNGLGSAFDGSGYETELLTALAVVAGVFLVIAGFWIVVRNLIRSANMTGRRR